MSNLEFDIEYRSSNQNYISNLQRGLNVKDFGAIGNGIADDTLAIQNAINQASDVGNTVYIGEGIYVISSTLIIKNNVRVIGAGSGVTKFIYVGSGSCIEFDRFFVSTMNNCGISGISIEGDMTDTTNHGVNITTKYGLNKSFFKDLDFKKIGGNIFHFETGIGATAKSVDGLSGSWASDQGANVTIDATNAEYSSHSDTSIKLSVSAGATADYLATKTFSSTDFYNLATSGRTSLATDLLIYIRPSITLYPGDIQFTFETGSVLETMDLPRRLQANKWHRVLIPYVNTSLTATKFRVKMAVDVGAFNLWLDEIQSVSMGKANSDNPWWNQYIDFKNIRSGYFDHTKRCYGHGIYAMGGFSTNTFTNCGLQSKKGNKIIKYGTIIPENNKFITVDPQAINNTVTLSRGDSAWTAVSTKSTCSVDSTLSASKIVVADEPTADVGQIVATFSVDDMTTVSGAVNLYECDVVHLNWRVDTKTLVAGTFQFILSDIPDCSNVLETIDIPAVTSDTQTRFNIGLKNKVKEVKYIGLKKAIDCGTGTTTVYIKDFMGVHLFTTTELTGTSTFNYNNRAVVTTCEDGVWTSKTNTTTTEDNSVYVKGSKSTKIAVADAFTTGVVSDAVPAFTYDSGNFTHLCFWLRSSVALSAGDYRFRLNNSNHEYSIPAMPANIWTFLCYPILTAPGNVTKLELNQSVDKGAMDLYIDQVILFKNEDNGFYLLNTINTSFDNCYFEAIGQYDDYSSMAAIMIDGFANKNTNLRNCLLSASKLPVRNFKALNTNLSDNTFNYTTGSVINSPLCDIINFTSTDYIILGKNERLDSNARTYLIDNVNNSGSMIRAIGLNRYTDSWRDVGRTRPSVTQSGDYTLALTDAETIQKCTKATAQALTIPPDSSVNFPINTVIEVYQYGAGQVTLTPGSGVTLRSAIGLKTSAQYAKCEIRKIAQNEWLCSGGLVV